VQFPFKYRKVGRCWICQTNDVDKDGYARGSLNGSYGHAHRLVYEWKHGRILSKEFVVRHKCDNRMCVNPSHLKLGTHADNVADRVKRGRSAFGEKAGRAILSEDQARRIKYDQGHSKASLARLYGVDRKTIRLIQQGVNWAHI